VEIGQLKTSIHQIIIAIVSASFTFPCVATETIQASNPIPILSSAIIGIGMGLDGRSSVSDEVRSGSNFHFEAVRNLGDFFSLGLRTVAEGSLNSTAPFQRMASDLIASLRPSPNTRISFGFGRFSESGQLKERSEYRLRGKHFSLQIQHLIHQMARLRILSSLSWGISHQNPQTAMFRSTGDSSRIARTQKSNGFGIAFEFPFDTDTNSSLSDD
jgi:hypothetical protein